MGTNTELLDKDTTHQDVDKQSDGVLGLNAQVNQDIGNVSAVQGTNSADMQAMINNMANNENIEVMAASSELSTSTLVDSSISQLSLLIRKLPAKKYLVSTGAVLNGHHK